MPPYAKCSALLQAHFDRLLPAATSNQMVVMKMEKVLVVEEAKANSHPLSG